MADVPASSTPRWGCYFRRPRRTGGPVERWQLIVTCGTKAAAEGLLLRLATTQKGSGDWTVKEVGELAVGTSDGLRAGRRVS